LASCERAACKYDKEQDVKVILFSFHGASVFEPRSDFKFEVAAMCASNPDHSPLRSTAETQPQLQPALLSLSAMISQYFIFSRLCSQSAIGVVKRNYALNVAG